MITISKRKKSVNFFMYVLKNEIQQKEQQEKKCTQKLNSI